MTPPPPSPSSAEETPVWRGTPSHWTNFGTYLFCLLLAGGIIAAFLLVPEIHAQPLFLLALAVPVFWMLARWIATRCNRYEITSERIKITTGLLSRRTSELELYRVRDYSVVEPFWLRLVGCGHIVLVTADRTNSQVILHAVPQARTLKDHIRMHTELMRHRRGVRELDIDSPSPP